MEVWPSLMEWGFITALVLAVTVFVLPAALVWHLHAGNIQAFFRNIMAKITGRDSTPKNP
jgi:hypothetical protein